MIKRILKKILKIGFIFLALLFLGIYLLEYILYKREAVNVNLLQILPIYKQIKGVGGSYLLWSPEGDKIAFISGYRKLYTVTLDGKEKNYYLGDVWNYLWLPDGRILYKEYETHDLWISDAQGKEKIRLTDGYKIRYYWLPGKKAYLFSLIKDEKKKEEMINYLDNNYYKDNVSFSHKRKTYHVNWIYDRLNLWIKEDDIIEQLTTEYEREYNWLPEKEAYLWELIGNDEQKRIRVERLLYGPEKDKDIIRDYNVLGRWGLKREKLVLYISPKLDDAQLSLTPGTKGRPFNSLWLLDTRSAEVTLVERDIRFVRAMGFNDSPFSIENSTEIFSPCGDYLLYLHSGSFTRSHLWLYNIKTKEKTLLCKYYDCKRGGYRWSPDETKFAYVVYVPTYNPRYNRFVLFLQNCLKDTGKRYYNNWHGIAVSDITTGKTTIYRGYAGYDGGFYMDFSPDGKQLAFFSEGLRIATLEK